MSLWWLVFLVLVAEVIFVLVYLFVPLPAVVKNKLIRLIERYKTVLLGIALVCLGLTVMEYMNSEKYAHHLGDGEVGLKSQLLNQTKEFRAQRNFYMGGTTFVLSLVIVGINSILKKNMELIDRIEVLEKRK
ncbi:hypothetical protein ABK040_009576 [Willaertia magna]